MTRTYDILGIGNAIMDILAPVTEADLQDMGIVKGGMTLIDQDGALSIHEQFKVKSTGIREIAGGSAANTLVGVSMLGVSAAYIGKVADDPVGDRFAAGLRSAGVDYETPALVGQEATARCLIAVTPDGERSMSTFLGATSKFSKQDVLESWVKSAKVIYLEGYLFDKDEAKAAFVKAAEIAQTAGGLVALTLSDSFCVDRHRASFRHLVDNHVDILFANEDELLSLYEQDDFDAAIETLSRHCKVACVTRSEKGSVILADGTRHIISAASVDKVVDTTGAGDQYAAGVLAGFAMGLTWDKAGALGSRCAAEVISHYGARPETKVDI